MLIRSEVAAIKRRFGWVLLIGIVQVSAAAREVSRIELSDGSVVSGDVVGFADGRYLVESPTLGREAIAQSQIRSLQLGGAAGGSPPGDGPQTADLLRQMMRYAEIMGTITARQSDPQVQAAPADPEFMHLMASGKRGALQSNPRFKRHYVATAHDSPGAGPVFAVSR